LLVIPTIVGCTIAALAQPGKPPATRQLRANGADLSYIEEGKGAPVVFAHGAVGDLRFWEPQRQAFAKGHRFVAYTYRYHGTAPWPDEGKLYSANTHAADLAAFIEGLKAGPVHLVGLSYGGMVAAMVAVKQPQLIRTLTLAEPSLFALVANLPDGKPVLETWGKDVTPMIAALKAGDNLEATKILVSVVNGQPRDHWEKLPAELRQMLSDNARTLSPLFAAEPAAVPCEELGRVKVPTLLIRGQRTPEIFAKTNDAVGRCMPGSRSVVIPNAAHTMSYDNPAAFNRTVLEFVAKEK
jgi:pimeloyl-ACP methyl ester carboxylesterase